VIDFFNLSNPQWLSISLAVAFEVGAAASLASLITLEKMNKTIVWMLFIILTLMQAMGNTYYAYVHLKDFQGWIELFGLAEEDLIYQKRILSITSGAILPVVALGFIKSLVDYIRPEREPTLNNKSEDNQVITNEIVKIENSFESQVSPDQTDEILQEASNQVEQSPRIDNIISIDNRIARGFQ
jgi:hypothetical protein